MVTYGLPFEVMDAVDRGVARTIGDLLHLVHGVEGGSHLTSMVRVIAKQFEGDRGRRTVAADLELYRRYQPGIDWVLRVLPGRTRLNKAPYRAAFALCHMVEPAPGLTEDFVARYQSGAGLGANEPVRRVREFTIKNDVARCYVPEVDYFRIACNALRSHYAREEVRGISRDEAAITWLRAELKNEKPGFSKGGAA